jgi:quercetin dioxygenase-like cupin family protein
VAHEEGNLNDLRAILGNDVAIGVQFTVKDSTPGQTFYEGPDDVHVVDRNASSTKPAKFLVFLIKNKGAPALVPVQ